MNQSGFGQVETGFPVRVETEMCFLLISLISISFRSFGFFQAEVGYVWLKMSMSPSGFQNNILWVRIQEGFHSFKTVSNLKHHTPTHSPTNVICFGHHMACEGHNACKLNAHATSERHRTLDYAVRRLA